MPSVLTGVSTRVPDALLADMYRDRKRVFIDLLGWDLPALDDRFEIDQFDGPDTLYLIVGSPDDDHLGSIRLLPTDRPTVIGEIFDHLCEAGAPASPRIWELSRLCLSPRIRAARRREVRNRLLTSAVKIAMENGLVYARGAVLWLALQAPWPATTGSKWPGDCPRNRPGWQYPLTDDTGGHLGRNAGGVFPRWTGKPG
jgi:N-acyl-L-homoserine lactone synthetase